MESVRNARNNNHLIEDIMKMTSLEREDWNIDISWVKAHVGIVGNEMAFLFPNSRAFAHILLQDCTGTLPDCTAVGLRICGLLPIL